MHQETNLHQEQQHLLDQITIPALPPEFCHSDIAKQYQDGEFTSRLDAEIADILCICQKVVGASEVTLITLSGEALAGMKQLNCIALIQDGQVLPLLDIEQMSAPMTAAQRIHLYHAITRTLLDAIAAILEDRAESRERPAQQDDDTEGGSCYAR